MAADLRLRRQSVAAALVCGWSLGCGTSSPNGGDSGTSDAASDVAADVVPNNDGGSNDSGGGDADAGDASDSGYVFVDIADTTCGVIDAGVTVVTGPDAPRFVTLGLVGSQRFAASEDLIATFDQTGGSVVGPFAPTGADLVVASAESSDVAVAQLGGGGVGFSRWLVSGSASLAVQTLQSVAPTGDPALAIASKPAASLVVWRESTNMRGLEYTSSAGSPVDFGPSTVGTTVDVVAAYDGTSDYGVVWSSDPGDGAYRLRFTKWSSTSTIATFYRQADPIHVEAMQPVSGGGWAVLASSGLPLSVVMLFFIDASGNLVPPIHRYTGAQYAWALARSSSGFGLVALRNSGEPEFRSLDPSGAALSNWVCLAGTLGTMTSGAGVDQDTLGYATVFTSVTGGAGFVRLDKNGVPQ